MARCPFAVWLPGPEWKTGYNGASKTHAKVGAGIHSAEYESTPEWDDAKTLYNALFSEREASWTFSIVWFLNGEALFQHYPIGTVCWAQGYEGNLWLDSIELEDIAPDGITEGQFALLVKTLRWVRSAHSWNDAWAIGNRQTRWSQLGWPVIFEHNSIPFAPATRCAVFTNGQVDQVRLLASLEEDDMAQRIFVGVEGRSEVYERTASGLVHITSPELFVALGGDWAAVKKYPFGDPIWDLPVLLPAGLPAALKTA